MAPEASDLSGSRRKRTKTWRLSESEQQGFITGVNLKSAFQSPPDSPTMSTMPKRAGERPAKRQKRAENDSRDGKPEHNGRTKSNLPRRAKNGMILPSFSPADFPIYRWNAPAMNFSTFPDISASRRVEKARKDALERKTYIDDGADNWYAFEGRIASYTDPGEKDHGQMARSIASAFVIRAKVALWASRCWADFEDEELAVRTQAAARAEPDPVMRQELLDDSLCEVSRLQVFELIKERLCNEIFLDKYDHQRLAEERERKDSVLYPLSHPGQTQVFPQRRIPQPQQVAEGEKVVRSFQTDSQSTMGTFPVSQRDRRVANHRLPVSTPQYKDEKEDADGTIKTAWFSKYKGVMLLGRTLPTFLPHPLSHLPLSYNGHETSSARPLLLGDGCKYQLSYQRPVTSCRTFNSSVVEEAIQRIQGEIADPDLKRLFENSYPNTLDTAVRWKGTAAGSDEELTFLITGDIDAMWLRDSANQVQSYLPLLEASSESNSLASLYRGVINLQARYLLIDPYCNSFQPPVESGLDAKPNQGASGDIVVPVYSNTSVFECKYELDSLAAFLEVSYDYYQATKDAEFFGKYQWVQAVEAVLKTVEEQMVGTYEPDGRVSNLPYQFARQSSKSTETQANNGLGNPFNNGTGLVRSFFRPSDDSTIYQGLIPSNMMFSRYLAATADIAAKISGQEGLAQKMRDMAESIKNAISTYGIIEIPNYGKVYAFEVDGYCGQNIMDDANIPSLLSAPFFGYLDANDEVYQRTRKLILSAQNPYFMRGPVINAIGGPHNGPGYAWPMASIVRILTSSDDAEITEQLREIVSSTDGLGLIHESINTFNGSDWTRQWFSWANGLFGQAILDLSDRKADILKQSFQ
ncbi:hypothetical protein BST61_g1033 [Cercospora zeina]